MQTIIIVLLTIIIVLSILATIYISLYNKLQFSKIRIEEAQKIIVDELQNRYNLIQSSKKTIEKNTKMDLSMFDELEKFKNSNTSSYDFDKKITSVLVTIEIIKNDYPKIDEKKEFKEILRKIDESNTKIDAAKSFYNKHNSRLVSLIKAFPSNVVASIHGIEIQPFYEAKEIFNEIDDGIKI